MKDFSKVKFKGKFRHYQQNVLDNTLGHIQDGKIHIVAAPGSGKTILGLELVRFLGKPALILSPSITIRNQWGERFEEGFLEEGENIDDYISYSLKDPKLLISITIQGLHAAYNKLVDKDDTNSDILFKKVVVDYSEFDLLETIDRYNIRTICLDEAHHLRGEWHRSLTEFIQKTGKHMTIISLTATPPYDSSPKEWKKYMNLCGPIDDEIFVPELIARKNLCPHQDYIYFNYPSSGEKKDLKEYKNKALKTLDIVLNNRLFKNMTRQFLKDYMNPKYNLFEDIEHYITLVNIAKRNKKSIPAKLKKIVRGRKFLDQFDLEHIERLLEYIISKPQVFSKEVSSFIDSTFKSQNLIELKKVNLKTNTRLKKALVSSIGKLRSIGVIAKFESEQLKDELRMLVLTDYIKKELIDIIGTNEENNVMGAVPIFEEVRRNVGKETRITLLTGSLIIVPNEILDELDKQALISNTNYTTNKLSNADYSVVKFKSSNKNRVHILTALFEAGHIQVLIGTKSLLGEGWDSPSINTLVLASFVGSFMLSNQMRGRAIRIDKSKPDKVASIWHLATIEPDKIVDKKLNELEKLDDNRDNEILSHDYHTLERRFKTFLGPVFTTPGVRSGIERVDIIKPAYNESKFKKINKEMLSYASKRDLVRDKWIGAVGQRYKHEIEDVSVIPNETWPKEIFIVDAFLIIVVSILALFIGNFLIPDYLDSRIGQVISIAFLMFYSYFLMMFLPKALGNLSPRRSVHALGKVLLKTLIEIEKIKDEDAVVVTNKDLLTQRIHCSLSKSSRHDKVIFSDSINEIMTQIDNPRYLIIKKRRILKRVIFNYSASYSVPKDIALKKESVELFAKYLKRTKGNYEVVYTRTEKGRDTLLKCKRKSRLSRHLVTVKSNKVLR